MGKSALAVDRDVTKRGLRGFRAELAAQRWDDHRLYHHSRINQSLHLFSALCFLTSYALLAIKPGLAVFIGWLLAMWSRQVGHFFFEPRSYDAVNGMSHREKEDVKVGYNLRRKVVLLTVWASSPLLLLADPSLGGLREPHGDLRGLADNVALLWLVVGVGGLLFRTVQLVLTRGTRTGLAWCTKVLTDPLHDVQLYHRSPLYLLRGEFIDPMIHVNGAVAGDGGLTPAG